MAAGYQLARTMVPLMETALDRSRELAPNDPVAEGLAEYLERHIPEEMHGDEPGGAALDDLEALGVDRVALQAQLPPPKMAALLGAQYFSIFHYHPVAILGFSTSRPTTPTVRRWRLSSSGPGFRATAFGSGFSTKLDAVMRAISTVSSTPSRSSPATSN